ncbi:hypothetical protein [Bartonella sp. W8122]|nr:hypothetical protein [Bartonella sp. W8122]
MIFGDCVNPDCRYKNPDGERHHNPSIIIPEYLVWRGWELAKHR